MRRLRGGLILFLLIAVSGLVGCSLSVDNGDPDETIPYISGLIYAMGDNYILVVEDIEDIDVPYETWFERGHGAIHLNITDNTVILGLDGDVLTMDELEPGTEVQAWVAGAVRESYPEQAEAKRIVVSKAKTPDAEDDPEADVEFSEGEVSGEDGAISGNDVVEREVAVREEKITIPGLLRSLSTARLEGSRPDTKEIQLVHGIREENIVFRLVNFPQLPFSTYIPGESSNSGFRLLTHGHLHGEYSFLSAHNGDLQLLRISDVGPETSQVGQFLDVLFLDGSTSLQEAQRYLKERLETGIDAVPLDGHFPDWFVEGYMFDGAGETLGFATLGQYKEQFFILYSQWNRKGEADWLPAARVILEEWSWKSEDQPRPSEQVFTVFVEGNEEHIVCRLIDFPEIPFTVYFPVDNSLDARSIKTGQLQGIRIGYLDILFFPENMTKREAEFEFELVLSYLGDMSPVPRKEVPYWALSKYTGFDRSSFKVALLGEYERGYFYIREQYPPEFGDGWSPFRSIIFSTWRWKDGGKSL